MIHGRFVAAFFLDDLNNFGAEVGHYFFGFSGGGVCATGAEYGHQGMVWVVFAVDDDAGEFVAVLFC